MRVAGKTVLITGAARGTGRAFAETYAREGARVVLGDIDVAALRATAAEIGDTAIVVEMDVSDLQSIETAVKTAIDALGRIGILIENAVVFTAAPIVDNTDDDFTRCFDINVKGALFAMPAVAQDIIDQSINGRIINMASQAGRRGEPLVAVYCATEAAIISLTQSAGLNLIPYGINVNAISPGVVDGEHWDGVDALFAKYENKAPGQKTAEATASVPFGRMGVAEDLTGMAVFLAGDEAR